SPCFVFLVGPCLIGINPACILYLCIFKVITPSWLSGSLRSFLYSLLCILYIIPFPSSLIFLILLFLKKEFVLFLTGADNIRKYWSRYYQGSQGVIFVLDSASSEDDLETARNELHSALQHPQLCTLPFLILANHQDKPAARSVQEVCLRKVTALVCQFVALVLPCWNLKKFL
ncbi:hypothetical protein FD755_018855, partial [Muntiacus reevesi]